MKDRGCHHTGLFFLLDLYWIKVNGLLLTHTALLSTHNLFQTSLDYPVISGYFMGKLQIMIASAAECSRSALALLPQPPVFWGFFSFQLNERHISACWKWMRAMGGELLSWIAKRLGAHGGGGGSLYEIVGSSSPHLPGWGQLEGRRGGKKEKSAAERDSKGRRRRAQHWERGAGPFDGCSKLPPRTRLEKQGSKDNVWVQLPFLTLPPFYGQAVPAITATLKISTIKKGLPLINVNTGYTRKNSFLYL